MQPRGDGVAVIMFHLEHLRRLCLFTYMERMDRPQYGKHLLSTAAYEAGLRAAFVVCHEPLPKRMEEVLERLHTLEDKEVGH